MRPVSALYPAVLNSKFLNGVRRIALQNAADPVVIVVAAVHGKVMFNPELPPKEMAVVRALVGSEGSTVPSWEQEGDVCEAARGQRNIG